MSMQMYTNIYDVYTAYKISTMFTTYLPCLQNIYKNIYHVHKFISTVSTQMYAMSTRMYTKSMQMYTKSIQMYTKYTQMSTKHLQCLQKSTMSTKVYNVYKTRFNACTNVYKMFTMPFCFLQ